MRDIRVMDFKFNSAMNTVDAVRQIADMLEKGWQLNTALLTEDADGISFSFVRDSEKHPEIFSFDLEEFVRYVTGDKRTLQVSDELHEEASKLAEALNDKDRKIDSVFYEEEDNSIVIVSFD